MTKLLSFQKKLSNEFVKHIETTKDLCLYRLGVFSIPRSVIFPNATYLTLINCSKTGISNILNPDIFPNIHTINYLSTNPDKNLLHTRFSSHVNWIFPDKNYDFYNFMTEMGYGRKDSNILNKYIHKKRIIDGKNGFDKVPIEAGGILPNQEYRKVIIAIRIKERNKVVNPNS